MYTNTLALPCINVHVSSAVCYRARQNLQGKHLQQGFCYWAPEERCEQEHSYKIYIYIRTGHNMLHVITLPTPPPGPSGEITSQSAE